MRVTAVRTAGIDTAGDFVDEAEERWDIDDVDLAPVTAGEDSSPGRTAVSDLFDLFARGQTDLGLLAGDQVEVDEVVYEVDGVPAVWPLGTVVRLKRVTG